MKLTISQLVILLICQNVQSIAVLKQEVIIIHYLSFKHPIVNLLPGLITADLSGADIVVQGEQPVQEHTKTNQSGWQQPASVETCKKTKHEYQNLISYKIVIWKKK